MNRPLLAALTLVAALAGGASIAQTAAPKPGAKPAQPAAKPARKPAPKPAPKPVEPPVPAADDAQRAAAELAHYGDYACEFNQTVSVARDPKHDAYAEVKHGKQVFLMKPVLSSTGALRLEDVKGQALMIQIAVKSMLMDVKLGRRLVDECVHEKQAIAKKAMEGAPQQAGIGIDPSKAATPIAAAASAAEVAASAAVAAASAAEAAASAAQAAAAAASAASAPAPGSAPASAPTR